MSSSELTKGSARHDDLQNARLSMCFRFCFCWGTCCSGVVFVFAEGIVKLVFPVFTILFYARIQPGPPAKTPKRKENTMGKNKIPETGIYDARQLGRGRMLLLGFQHMFAMFRAASQGWGCSAARRASGRWARSRRGRGPNTAGETEKKAPSTNGIYHNRRFKEQATVCRRGLFQADDELGQLACKVVLVELAEHLFQLTGSARGFDSLFHDFSNLSLDKKGRDRYNIGVARPGGRSGLYTVQTLDGECCMGLFSGDVR